MLHQRIDVPEDLNGRARINFIFKARHPVADKQERTMRRHNAKLQDRFGHKREGTPETHDKASQVRQGALARLFMGGHLSADQLAWAAEIRAIAERIGRDVAIGTVSLETRVDCGGAGNRQFDESLRRVRSEVAYSSWRGSLKKPAPVLAMIVDDLAVRSTAEKFRMRDQTARGLLTTALDMWPDHCQDARDRVDEIDLRIFAQRVA